MAVPMESATPPPSTDLEQIFREHHGLVFRAAYRITGNAGDAEDVLQTVFLRMVKRDATADPVGNMASFLHRAAVNAALDLMRTRQNIRNIPLNFVSEVIGTFVLVFVVLAIGTNGSAVGLAALGALPVALLVWSIGLSLGGTTGYAINPARDLGPRIIHAILPIPGKGDSDWSYSWVPVAGPVVGGILAAVVYGAVWINTMGM